jgi:hypothetical protein
MSTVRVRPGTQELKSSKTPEIPVNQQNFRFFIGRNLISIFGSQFQIWAQNSRKKAANLPEK